MAKRRYSSIELASIANDPYLYGFAPTWGKIRLSSKDRFLVEQGGTGGEALDLYLNLLTDPQAYFAWDRQISEITSREWTVEAGGDDEIDKLAAEFVEETLASLSSHSMDMNNEELAIVSNGQGFDGITRGLGLALITGISVAEIIWKQDKDYLPTVETVKVRDPRRFHFDVDSRGHALLKLKTRKHNMDGIYLPARKFIVCRYWAIPNDDPYGAGLGRLLYYPVTWKRELLTLWLSIVDKYADPTVVGTYDQDIEENIREDFQRGLENITRDMVMSMPSHFKVDFMSPTLNGPDILSNLESLCNAYINKVVSGEANTGESGGGGVMRENVSNSIRLMKAKAFSDLISESLNNSMIKWLSLYRFPKAKPPRVWRNFGDASGTIDMLEKLRRLGFNTNHEYIENLTGIPITAPEQRRSFG